MVGRTPEYLGKKVEAYDVQMAMLYLLIFPLVILGLRRCPCCRRLRAVELSNNHGPHGLTQILYAYHVGGGE